MSEAGGVHIVDVSPGSGAFYYTIASFVTFAVIKYFAWKRKYYGDFRKTQTIRFHTLEVNIAERDVTVKYKHRKDDRDALVTRVGTTVPEYLPCHVTQTLHTLVLDWPGYAKLTISHRDLSRDRHRYDIDWLTYSSDTQLQDDVMMLEGGHWYGVGHVLHQPWPIERWFSDIGAFVTRETPPFATSFGEVQERMWITSSGVALLVDFHVPLFVSTNYDYDNTIKLRAKFGSPYQNQANKTTFLRYTILQTDADVREAFGALRDEKLIPLPEDIPDESIFRHPIWSTWAQYKKDITQAKVEDFAKAIKDGGFKASQLEIDDGWTPKYGDWEFDQNKFPDPKAMMKRMKDFGYRVTLWVHPFASFRSSAFKESRDPRMWVRWKVGFLDIPALTSWWNGYGALLDISNTEAVEWFRQKLGHLREQFGIHSFKVDAGEAGRLSTWTRTKKSLDNPNTYTKLFAEMTHSLDTEHRAQELRVGVGCQNLPLFFRLQDKDSNWTSYNGIRTVIPHVLTQGLIGYPFVLPDMIGGNAYFAGLPDKELYIRWVQLNALMPAMQFSIVPWMYDEETVDISRKMCQLHERYSSKIIDLAKEATRTGAPIVRPVWWIAPKDEAALTISTEFLLGDDVIVAPVLEKGARKRDIYLPAGTWRDEICNNQLEGGRWFRDYPADLDHLPHFTKL